MLRFLVSEMALVQDPDVSPGIKAAGCQPFSIGRKSNTPNDISVALPRANHGFPFNVPQKHLPAVPTGRNHAPIRGEHRTVNGTRMPNKNREFFTSICVEKPYRVVEASRQKLSPAWRITHGSYIIL